MAAPAGKPVSVCSHSGAPVLSEYRDRQRRRRPSRRRRSQPAYRPRQSAGAVPVSPAITCHDPDSGRIHLIILGTDPARRPDPHAAAGAPLAAPSEG